MGFSYTPFLCKSIVNEVKLSFYRYGFGKIPPILFRFEKLYCRKRKQAGRYDCRDYCLEKNNKAEKNGLATVMAGCRWAGLEDAGIYECGMRPKWGDFVRIGFHGGGDGPFRGVKCQSGAYAGWRL